MSDSSRPLPPEAACGADPIGWKPAIKIVLLVAIVAGCVVAIRNSPWKEYFFDPEARLRLRESCGAWLPLAYTLAGAAVIAVGFPRVWYVWFGGGLFGFVEGLFWGHAATMVGSMLNFWFARTMGREWARRKLGRRFPGLEQQMREQGFAILLLVRLCPIGNATIANCLAGVSSIGSWAFFWATILGHLPLAVFFALMGSGIVKSHSSQTAGSLIGLVAFTLVFMIYFRRSRRAREIARQLMNARGSEKANGAANERE
ncbi:MAG: SNARE associated Golgi protein [candidate division BRC1 bacterium ADurb.BinA364]|nr:MAG: SNARE associated Golgi protein [candidate division BRC1 bacterium ADurb.BinA364]